MTETDYKETWALKRLTDFMLESDIRFKVDFGGGQWFLIHDFSDATFDILVYNNKYFLYGLHSEIYFDDIKYYINLATDNL